MELQDFREHLDKRLDTIDTHFNRIEGKLDDHLERISKAEIGIDWLKGCVRIGVTILVATLTGAVGALYRYIIK